MSQRVTFVFPEAMSTSRQEQIMKATGEAFSRLKRPFMVSEKDLLVLGFTNPEKAAHPAGGVAAWIKNFWWDRPPTSGPKLDHLKEVTSRSLKDAAADVKLVDVIEGVIKDAEKQIQHMKIKSVAILATGVGAIGALISVIRQRAAQKDEPTQAS